MKLKNESGRSMVEMLGVLAIIGVLSVGGISGYKIHDQLTLVCDTITFTLSSIFFGQTIISNSFVELFIYN